MKDLLGKTAFITGGASGIGFGIANGRRVFFHTAHVCKAAREPEGNRPHARIKIE